MKPLESIQGSSPLLRNLTLAIAYVGAITQILGSPKDFSPNQIPDIQGSVDTSNLGYSITLENAKFLLDKFATLIGPENVASVEYTRDEAMGTFFQMKLIMKSGKEYSIYLLLKGEGDDPLGSKYKWNLIIDNTYHLLRASDVEPFRRFLTHEDMPK